MRNPPFCTVLREPKGGPDAVLAGYASETALLTKAANILSVQGRTCRIVLLPDGTSVQDVPAEERAALFPAGVPAAGFCAFDNAQEADAAKLAKKVMEAIEV